MRRLLTLLLILVLMLPVFIGCVVHHDHPSDQPETDAGPRDDVPRTTETIEEERIIDRRSEFEVESDR
ncbi:MAG: hypothetical protein E3J72_06270 [Planctomycetota bacterium]|nr:MAG: hypothetical protein E3J72_06270 [Planctomycetota bacterium]